MRKLLLLPFILGACSTAPAESPSPAGNPAAPGGTCNANALASFEGREATAETGTEILRASGARVLRWVQPGMAVTMDFREDRVTIYLTAANKIERASCG